MKTFSKRPGNEGVTYIDCPVCGNSRKKVFVSCDEFTFARCLSCGLVYQDPQPLPNDLSRRYDKEYFNYELENEDNFYTLMRLGLNDIRFDRISGKIEEPRRFLDVGCATGRLIYELSKEGWEAEGVELCPPSAQFAREQRKMKVFNGTLENAAFPGGYFNVVHASHLIEHLTDPKTFLEEIRRILHPRGYCILVTPNVSGFQARLFRGCWRSAIADHMCLFSLRTMKYMLEREGFRVVRTKTWGGIGKGMAPPIVKKIVDRGAKMFGFGDVMILLARKTE